MSKTNTIGNCTDENLVADIFGSLTQFAYEVETKGNDFFTTYKNQTLHVRYVEETAIHYFDLI